MFRKKPELGLQLIERSLKRGYRPGIVLIDAGYGNNTSFLKSLEEKNLKYLGGLARNRKVKISKGSEKQEELRLDEVAQSLSEADFQPVVLEGEKKKTLWVAILTAETSRLEAERNFAIVMNASSYQEAKGWLGLKEYQVRGKRSLIRHFVLVFCAYTFILYHRLTGGIQRQWASKPLETFTDALEAFRTAMSFRFFEWLTENRDVFARYKASLGYIWA